MNGSNHDIKVAELSGSELYKQGSKALAARNYPLAHHLLLAALERERSAEHLSQYALSLAHHTGNVQGAAALCREAIKKEPRSPGHYLRLATIYLIGGIKKEAIRILHLGLRAGKHPGISDLLQILGHRQPPVLPFLSRGNPLNRYLGRRRMSRTQAR
jgi:predicted Zn-dependent protease